MVAMNYDCCQYFAGPEHTLDDFENFMTRLVERTDSQYSYQNALVAVSDDEQTVMGVCISYDGGQLHALRRPFIDMSRQCFGMDHSSIDDETQAGELYADSLCVNARFRGRGIATALLQATIAKAKRGGYPAVGLLVDKGNPQAERLYARIGFRYVDDNTWGGHPMRHLQYPL